MTLRDILSTRNELILKTIVELNAKINNLPEGRIIIKQHKDSVYYEWSKNNSSHYLSKNNTQIIQELSQKHYLKKVLKAANQEAKALGSALKSYPEHTVEEIYDLLSEEYKKNAKPIIPGDQQFITKWLETPYKQKPFKKDDPCYFTLKGERVRSKSEVIIADRLYANGIPYKYECPLKAGNQIIHPDFTVLRMSDRKILYHEHCGKMDDPGYTENLVNRINLYALEKIFQGDRLFFSYESAASPLNTDILDDMIRTIYR